MKTRLWMACVLLLSLIAAQPGLPAGAFQSPPEPGAEYLLSLPVPAPSPDVPANLTPEGAAVYARQLLLQQANPVLSRLHRLREERAIVDFEVRPDLYGVVVQLAKSAEPDILQSLPGVTGVSPAAEDQSCVQGAARALEEQLLAASHVAAAQEQSARAAALADATNPSITVYRNSDGSYGYVYGYTYASTPVTLTVYRADGSVRVTRTTTSNSSGYYSFYPSYVSCPVSGNDWAPEVGDRVQVTAAGNTVSTTVVPLSLWMDPAADTVAGLTVAGRTVEVWAYHYGSDLCTTQSYGRMVASDSSGDFSASFAGSVDLTGTDYANAYVLDSNGNRTYYSVGAYSLNTQYDSSYFHGYLKPNLPFSATLTRGAAPIDTVTGWTNAGSYFYGNFGEAIQPGDLIEVTGGGVSVSLTAAPLTGLVFDPATDSVSGTTVPGRIVKGYLQNEQYYPSYNGCTYHGSCDSTTADGSGHFTLQASFDWMSGDYVYLYVYDAAGNYQYLYSRYAPLIMAYPGSSTVNGTWPERSGEISATLIREGTPIDTDTDSLSSGQYSFYFYPYPEPGDVIEVTDGSTTASMTVLDVTAHVNSLTDLVYGQAPARPATVRLDNYRREYGAWYSYCQETDLPGGDYCVDFGLDLGGADDAVIYVRGSDDHKTSTWGHAFWLAAYIYTGYNDLMGYTVEPSTGVHMELLDSGAVLKYSTDRLSDSYNGFYDAFLSPLIVPGDSIEVNTSDGWDATVGIPVLTAEQDEMSNQIYGESPPSQPVQPSLRRHYQSGYSSYTFTTWADAAGNYSVPLDGYYWWRDCSPLQAGDRCTTTAIQYYDSAGHAVYKSGAYPPPVEADSFEDDDVYTAATPYEDIQSHSFHDYPDYDWVEFTVPARDVANAVPYSFETFHLGWGMATQARLFESDGTTLVWDETAYENRGAGLDYLWTPTAAGTYYLELRPPSSYYSAYCDAVYDVRIAARHQVFLPLVMH